MLNFYYHCQEDDDDQQSLVGQDIEVNGLGDLAGGILRGDGGNGSVAADREERVPRVGCEIPAGVGEDIVFA